VIALTCDNASANTTMVEELATLLPRFLGAKVHVQCFAHTVNLAARGVLHPFE
ncbi:hypothetical protein BT96DRAFT_759771, partial [Gymnopus androsaceus JB14]